MSEVNINKCLKGDESIFLILLNILSGAIEKKPTFDFFWYYKLFAYITVMRCKTNLFLYCSENKI